MAIALATIRTDVYTTIYNHLQTGTYAITSSNIHPSYNNNQTIKEGYPQVVINEPKVSGESLTQGPATTFWEIPIAVTIEVYHNSSANAKTVADEVWNKIITGRSVLQAVGLRRIRFEGDDAEVIQYGQSKSDHIYRLNFSAIYRVTA